MTLNSSFWLRYNQLVKIVWLGILWLGFLLFAIILCFILEFNQQDFKKDYEYTKMQWHTKILPPEEMMTVSFIPNNSWFSFGLNEDNITLSAYHGTTPPKLIFDITQQVVYLNQAKLPQALENNTCRLNQITLIEATPTEKTPYPKTFIKEATIQAIVNNYDHFETIEDKQNLIGKRIITGTDYIKNKTIIENNFRCFFIFSKAIAVSILILLGFFSYKFHKRLNVFDKLMLVIISSVFIFYIYQSSLNYFNALT